MERINVRFNNCDLDSQVKSQFIADLGFYMRSAPSDASVCCCIHHDAGQYVCNLRVHSQNGHIHIHRESKSIETLQDYMKQSLSQSFKQWKANPQSFANSHGLGQTPCRDASHQVISCPEHSVANRSFEKPQS